MISIVSSSTKPMTSTSRPSCCSAKSRLSAAPPPTACSPRPSSVGRHQVVAQLVQRVVDPRVGLVVRHAEHDQRGRAVRRGLHAAAGGHEVAGGDRLLGQLVERGRDLLRARRRRTCTTTRRRGALVGREARADVLDRLHLRDRGGQRVEASPEWVFMPSAGMARPRITTPERASAITGWRTTGREQPAADAAAADPAVEPPQQRDPRAVDPAAELDQQRGQHGDRAEHGDRDDEDRADRERVEGRVADHEQAGHRRDHRAAGHQDRVARRTRRDLDRVQGGPALGALLALPLEVEERVVDADRHADQHDHAGDGRVGGDQVRHRARAGRGSPRRWCRRAAPGCRRRSARRRPAPSAAASPAG